MITGYPILGQSFYASIQLVPGTPTVPEHVVVQPDAKVIYNPFGPSPTPVGGVAASPALTVGDGHSTISVPHHLGTTDVHVTLFNVTGEEVDTDVTHVLTDPDTITLTFAAAPAQFAYRVVVS